MPCMLVPLNPTGNFSVGRKARSAQRRCHIDFCLVVADTNLDPKGMILLPVAADELSEKNGLFFSTAIAN